MFMMPVAVVWPLPVMVVPWGRTMGVLLVPVAAIMVTVARRGRGRVMVVIVTVIVTAGGQSAYGEKGNGPGEFLLILQWQHTIPSVSFLFTFNPFNGSAL
ncbi:MAG: hypothetical protein IJS96_02965 [Schwartzia sp.]|nr:hypothetical protein [Schwartzia sp. (in: firmicutes)]